MDPHKELLRKLISLPGLSGYEQPVRDAIADVWRPLVDELHTSPLGSLHALKRGSGDEPRRSILFMAHMDAIGLMVTRIVDGFLKIADTAGIDPRILPGQQVIVHGRRDIPGIIAQPNPALLPPALSKDQPVSKEYLLVETGLLPEETTQLVQIGDLVSFAQEPLDLSQDYLAGHSLDNRASITALTACLEELQNRPHRWDIWAVASVQEEQTLAGAFTSAFSIHPDLAVAVDVTFGRGAGGPSDYRTFPLGKGPTLGWGPNIHPGVYGAFKDLAQQLSMAFGTELMPKHSGTDAMGMQVAAEGIPTMVLSIPIRYMHTPIEVVSMQDIASAGHLMAEFTARLDASFLQNLSLDGRA